MDIVEVFNKWPLKGANKQASIDMWDSMAPGFEEQEIPSFGKDNFLKILQKYRMLKIGSHVLDVGCGTGKYALAIADRCKKVIGIDLSEKMIEIARKKATELNVTNVDFWQGDWHDLDLGRLGFEKRFDLVFAHMSPAVQSASTFNKLSEAGRGWCLMSKPTHRIDPVSDTVKGIVGIGEKRESSDQDIIYAFEILWQQGRLPYLNYERTQWNMEKTLEQAYGLYINRVKTYRDITPEEEDRIKEYLQSIAKNGLIREDVDTTITTLYWKV